MKLSGVHVIVKSNGEIENRVFENLPFREYINTHVLCYDINYYIPFQ